MNKKVKSTYKELEKIVESVFFNSFIKPTIHQILELGMWYKDSLSRIKVHQRLLVSITNAVRLLEELEKHGYLVRDKDDISRYLVTEKYQKAFFTVYMNFCEKHKGNSFLNTLEHVENDCNDNSIETHGETCRTEINEVEHDSE